jgi:hypothetical protein
MHPFNKKNMIALLLVTLAFHAGLVSASGLVRSERGQATYCKSLKDYEKAKTGVYSIAAPKVLLKGQQRLSIRVKVDVSQCDKLMGTGYRWKRVNPNENLEYMHSYNDLDSGEFVNRAVTVEHKKVWMAAVNKSHQLVATSDIKGDIKSGFVADFDMDISEIFSREQLSRMTEGESVIGRVGIFIKAIKRYVSDEIVTSYKEVGSGGMYYVLVNLRGEQGKLMVL